MKVIDLLNKIANGEIEDKTMFRIYFANNMYRDIYYDDEEQNQLDCLKNVSDDYSIYDDICLLDEAEIIEEEKEMCYKCHKYPAEYNQTWCEFCLGISKEEKKIPEKIEEIANGDFLELPSTHDIMNKINEIIDYLKSKGVE